jgi:hypothetical protein
MFANVSFGEPVERVLTNLAAIWTALRRQLFGGLDIGGSLPFGEAVLPNTMLAAV